MKTVLLVDDERPARELLKMTLDWNAIGFELPDEAANGKLALEKYRLKQPDFVITDIQMPVMDGLELIEEIRKINPNQHIVILSCHESFSYAQKAVKLGVMDYLVKDALNAESLIEILTADDAVEENQAEDDSTLLHLLKPLLNHEIEPAAAAAQLQRYWNPGTQFFCCAASTGRTAPDYVALSHIRENLQKALRGTVCGDIYWMGENTFYILSVLQSDASTMKNLNVRTQLLRYLRTVFDRAGHPAVTIGVSTPSSNPLQLNQRLQEAQSALKSYVFLGKGKTIYFDEAQPCIRLSAIKTMETRTLAVKKALTENEPDTLRQQVTLLYQKDLQGIMQYNYLQHVNTLLLSMLTERCLSADIPFKEVFGTEMLSQLPTNGSCDTAEEMLAWYIDKFDSYFAWMQAQKDYEQTPRLQKVKQYIDENYQSGDLTLESVAEHFGLHKVYLAKIFKNGMNCSVNEYIRNVKMDKAKELLTQGNMRISAIIETLGFNNPQTFYNTFKRCVGIHPKEYRQSKRID